MRIVVFFASTKSVPEVLIILVGFRRLIPDHIAFLPSRRVQAERAWRGFWHAACATVADKVALVEELD
jgi:hypothetical protein